MSKNKSDLLASSLGLPYFSTIDEFSELLRLSTRLLYCLSMLTSRYYQIKTIPKKNGKTREISIPAYSLRIVQKWILRNILDKLVPSDQSMAFRKGYGIKQNAIHHAQTLYGLSVDLKDFFPSIPSNKIHTIFSSIGYNNFAASILTNLCTLNGKLPQGSPCSPALSNMVCRPLDKRLIGFCQKQGIIYTRYADDMYFSCDNKALLLRYYPVIKRIIEDEGFEINNQKVHYHTPSNRKRITGVTIVQYRKNDTYEIKAPKLMKRRLRAEIFKCIVSGQYEDRKHIIGKIAYISYLESDNKFDYLLSLRKYIEKTTKKIEYFPELIEKYNHNRFFSDMPEITPVEVSAETEDELIYFCEIFNSRRKYLTNNNYDDICSYDNWPDDIVSYCVCSESCTENDDLTPF